MPHVPTAMRDRTGRSAQATPRAERGVSGRSSEGEPATLPGRLGGDVQAALALRCLFPPPASGALVLAGARRTGARLAADRNEAAVVQLVVRHVLFADMAPDVGERPAGQRVALQQGRAGVAGEVRVGLDLRNARTSRRTLIGALPGDPGVEARELALERLDLAHLAALLVAVLVEAEGPLASHQILDLDEVGERHVDHDAVVLAHRLEEAVSLGVQPPGVEAEDAEPLSALDGEIDEHDVLGTAERDRAALAEDLQHAREDLRGASPRELAL